MAHINELKISGEIADPPQYGTAKDGKVKYCNFTVCTKRAGKTGEFKEFTKCVAFGKLADDAKQFGVGGTVIVFGEKRTDSYTDKQGNKKAMVKCHCKAAYQVLDTSFPPEPGSDLNDDFEF